MLSIHPPTSTILATPCLNAKPSTYTLSVSAATHILNVSPSTLVNIPAFRNTLRNHIVPDFVQFLINGFSNGFHPGLFHSIPFTHIDHQSIINDLETVDTLLTKEIREDVMTGTFLSPLSLNSASVHLA